MCYITRRALAVYILMCVWGCLLIVAYPAISLWSLVKLARGSGMLTRREVVRHLCAAYILYQNQNHVI